MLPNDPGMLILRNYVHIENGPNATITTKKRSDNEDWNDAYWGGIIYANSAQFYNNKRAVEFMRYTPRNYSRFIDCEFAITDPTFPHTFQGVTMWATNGIQFSNCEFRGAIFPNQNGEGIGCLDATATIHNDCHFRNLQTGIGLRASMPLMGNILVGGSNIENGNRFGNNLVHISTTGIDQLYVYNNQFGLPASSNNIGIVAANTKGDIEHNTFFAMKIDIVALANTNGNLNIQCNNFQTADIGVWALGNNIALDIQSNEFFYNNLSDIMLSSIGSNQGNLGNNLGSITQPRFNLFSANLPNQHLRTNSIPLGGSVVATNSFWYFHPSPALQARLVPVCDDNDGCTFPNNYHNQDVGTVNNSTIPTCIDLDDSDDGGDWLIGGSGTDCQTRECLEIMREYISDLRNKIDKGNKEQIINDLNAYPNSYATYQNLYQTSPYLSDSLLLLIAQTEAMATWKRANLLVVNSPLSDEVMTSIAGLVPQYTYDILESIRYYDQLSARKILESRISDEERKKSDLLSHLLHKLVAQRDRSQIAEVLANENPRYALRTLSAAYLHNGNVEQAQALLDQIPIMGTEDQQFYDIQLINLERTTNPKFDLSPEQENNLRQIAADTYSTQSSYAQGLLWMYRGDLFDIELPNLASAQYLSGKIGGSNRLPRFSEADLNSLLLLPNPAINEVLAYIPPGKSGSTIAIYDLNGNQKSATPLDPQQRVGYLDVSQLPNGVYITVLQQGENIFSSAKLIVAH